MQNALTLIVFVLAMLGDISCAPERRAAMPQAPISLSGVAMVGGQPLSHGELVVTSLSTKTRMAVLRVGPQGEFGANLPPGEYALAIATQDAFAYLEKISVPRNNVVINLMRDCSIVNGDLRGDVANIKVFVERYSDFVGDLFSVSHIENGKFSICVPDAKYLLTIEGDAVAPGVDFYAPREVPLVAHVHDLAKVKSPPKWRGSHMSTDYASLLSEIRNMRPAVVGLGESTHGTSEFVTLRSEITTDLIRSKQIGLVLCEFDAIGGGAVDDYVNGKDVDLRAAIVKLRIWPVDTEEMVRFFEKLREMNATLSEKIHVWGVDVQDLKGPAQLLLTSGIMMSDEEKSALRRAASDRVRGFSELSAHERSVADRLLERISQPRSRTERDLLIAVAARSLAVQFHYWDREPAIDYDTRRDRGMADLVSFLAREYATPAALWAHAGHLTKEQGKRKLGGFLSAPKQGDILSYYNIEFIQYEGEFRAWDAAGKVGVVVNALPGAPEYLFESVIMNESGMPDVAWVPLRSMPESLRRWIEIPRYVREIGAVYNADKALTLRNVPEAMDAVVVVRRGHASTPTPTGVRVAKPTAAQPK